MIRPRKLSVAAALCALALVAGGFLRRACQDIATTSVDAAPPGNEPAPAARVRAVDAGAGAHDAAEAPAAATLRDAGVHPGAPETAIARMLHATDAHDRDLLADVERQTHAEPPAAVRELLALRRAGASRAELQRFIDHDLARQLVVRIAAQRWLRAALPEPGDPQSTPVPRSFGQGGGAMHVKPLRPQSR